MVHSRQENICLYSRYPEVEIVHSTAARSMIPKMDRIFATYGIPRVVKSNNGPPFASEEIKVYMEEKGIKHSRITPLWPQANSEAENFMKPVTKAIRAAHADGRDWQKDLYQFLLNYRATPHSTTGFAPSELLFNRKIKTKLPQISMKRNSDIDRTVQKNDERAKERMKKYADKRSRATVSNIQVGDTVLIRQRKQNKWSTKFDPFPFIVVRRKGTMITASRNGKYHIVGNFREGFIFVFFVSQEPFTKIKTAKIYVGHVQSERTTFQSGLYFKLSSGSNSNKSLS